MKLNLAVTGVGMLSAIGLSAGQCMHSVRSGIARLALEPLQDRARQWIAMGRVPLGSPHPRARHLRHLCEAALRQAWRMATAEAGFPRRARLGLVLGSPDAGRPGYRFPAPEGLQRWIEGQGLGELCHLEIMPSGASSAQMALHRAGELLRDGALDAMLIGAADTQAQFRVIRWHEDHMRLKCSYVNDGLMPAEAAAMLVVEPEGAAAARGARRVARVLSVAAAADQGTILADAPVTGQALTRAVSVALADARLRAQDIAWVWSDLNGESARAREWAYAEIRNRFEDHTELLHPADCQGDVGAATDSALLVLAACCQASGWSGGAPCLVVSSSEGGTRAATVLAGGDPCPELEVSRALPRPAVAVPDTADAPSDPLQAHFAWQLRDEHRDELASLYYQRKWLQAAQEQAWQRLRDPEQRMLNHLDALLADGPASIAAVLDDLLSEEEGLCFAGALLAGMLGRAADFDRITAALDPAGDASVVEARIAGVRQALAIAPVGEALETWLRTLLVHPSPMLRRLALEIAGAQEIDLREAWSDALADGDLAVAAAAARACARIPLPGCRGALQALVRRGEAGCRRDAMLALLRIDPVLARGFSRRWLEADAEFDGGLSLCLGICGHAEDAELLVQRLRQDEGDLHAIEAMGILGAPAGIGPLAELLGSESQTVKGAALRALELVCGRPFLEAKTPHASAPRQRLGRPHSAAACLLEIEDGASSANQRSRAAIELGLSLGLHVPYQCGWFVARQERSIASWRSHIAALR